MPSAIRALLARLRPRCGAPGPWRLVDCGPCIMPRGHHTDGWHGDGNGYTWNDVIGRWQWMGPVVDLAEVYAEDPDRDPPSFEVWSLYAD